MKALLFMVSCIFFATTERDAIPTPPEGLLIYNTTLDKFDYYTGGEWKTLEYTPGMSAAECSGTGYRSTRSEGIKLKEGIPVSCMPSP